MKNNFSLIFFMLIPFLIVGQTDYRIPIEKYIEKEISILNAVINSSQFDSINQVYNGDTCVFIENEILSGYIISQLIETNHRLKILDKSFSNISSYWVLGDLFLNNRIENPEDAVLQIEYIVKGKSEVLIGIDMKKKDGLWGIEYFTFIE